MTTPFGAPAPAFGQAPAPFGAAPAFGSPAPAPAGGLFGSPAPAQAPGGFGAPPAAPFGQAPAPAFGQAPAAPGGFGAPPAAPFGAPAPAPGLFGSAAPAPAFGATTTFGAPAAAAPTGGLFGTSTPAFGQAPAAPGAFGAPPAAPFGAPAPAPTTGLFGSTAPAPGGFGAPQPAAPFGSPAPAPSTGLFGAPAPAPGGFGAPPAAPFGAPAPAPGLFGSTAPAPAPTTGLFGSTAPAPGAFGAPPAPGGFGAAPAPTGGLFGSPAPAPGGFGAAPAPGGFGAPTAATPFSGGGMPGQGGTKVVAYTPTTKKDNQTTINLQSITAMQQYEQKSFEELRFEDYSQGNKGTASTPTAGAAGGFGFGAPAAAPAGGLFGQPAPAPGGFGAAPAAPFGAAPAPTGGLFGSPSPAPAFGATTAPSPFGAPAPTGGLFGSTAPAPAFGGAPAPSTGLFGAPSPAPGGFGQTPSPAPFGSAAPSPGLFGSTPSPAPGLFGAPGPAPAGGLFGAPAPSTGFGSTAQPGGLFGSPAPAPGGFGAPAPFGAAPAPFGSSGGLFGSAPAPLGGFGTTPAQPMTPTTTVQIQPTIIPQNTIIIPPTQDESNIQGLKALMKTKEEMEKTEIWKSDGGTQSKVTTPTSTSEAASLGPLSASKKRFFPSPAVSNIKVRPRGFPRTGTPAKSTPLLSSFGGRGDISSSSLLPAESSVRSPNLQLVIHPGALSKPSTRALPSPEGTEERTPAPKQPAEMIDPPPPVDDPTPPKDRPVNSSGQKSLSEEGKNALGVDASVAPKGSGPVKPSSGLEAYYQQTISSPGDVAPAATSIPVKSAKAPSLTKIGYETFPPLDELQMWADDELAAVKDFTVLRPGYGKIVWDGAVDVRAANLDRIVAIEPKDVSVYSQEEADGTKPAVGTALNRPAKIFYYEVFPKDNPEASEDEKQKFVKRLQKNCAKIGADFDGYNKTTGEWTIRVPHFSRYNLLDDDDSDEENEEPPQASPAVKPVSILNRKATPHKSISFEDEVLMSPEQAELASQNILELVTAKAHDVLAMEVVELNEPVEYDDGDDEEEEEEEEDEAQGLLHNYVPPDAAALETARTKPGIVGLTMMKKQQTLVSSVDAGLRMGKSFRVCFAPDGAIIVPQNDNKRDLSPSLSVSEPVYSQDFDTQDTESSLGFLDVHFRFSETENEKECPLFTLPQALGTNGSPESHSTLLGALNEFGSLQEKHSSKEAKSCFLLLEHLLGSSSAPHGSLKSSLLSFLSEFNKASVTREIQRSDSPAASVFAALRGGDVERATSIATESGLCDIATLISTLEISGIEKSDLSRLVQESPNGFPRDPSIDRLLKGLAGEPNNETPPTWQQCVALLAVSSPDRDIGTIIQNYLKDVSRSVAPKPAPSYDPSGPMQSVQFKLLRAFSNPEKACRLSDLVDPSGFSPCWNDSSLAFHLACAIAAAFKCENAQEDLERIASNYASQLILEGEWTWAVFVMLCVSPSPEVGEEERNRRIEKAKRIVLQHFDENAEGAEKDKTFLCEEIGVPTVWFSEAKSLRSKTVVGFIAETLEFDPQTSLSTIEQQYLPNVFFMSEDQLDKLMSLLEGMRARSDIADAVYRLFNLAERLAKAKFGGSDMATIQMMFHEAKEIEKVFTSRLPSSKKTGGYRFYVDFPLQISLASMLREALSRLSTIRLELGALAVQKEVS